MKGKYIGAKTNHQLKVITLKVLSIITNTEIKTKNRHPSIFITSLSIDSRIIKEYELKLLFISIPKIYNQKKKHISFQICTFIISIFIRLNKPFITMTMIIHFTFGIMFIHIPIFF